MKITLHDRHHTIAQASGDSLRRALNNLADHPSMTSKVTETELERLVIEFEPNFYETGIVEE